MNFLIIFLLFFNIILNAHVDIHILGTGLLLPYSIGICSYIKHNIPLQSYKLTGISGGAWCSLLFALEKNLTDHDQIWNITVGNKNTKLVLHKNLNLFHAHIEKSLKSRYKNVESSSIQNISILSSRFDNKKMKIFADQKNNFKNIDEIIDYSTCSSYIPFLSGSKLCKEYKNDFYMDGDLTRKQTNIKKESSLQKIAIHHSMWGRKFTMKDYIYTDINISRKFFEHGWNDTEQNRKEITKYLYYPQ